MWVDRDAAPVILDRDRVIGVQFHLDAVGVACNRLIHGVVEDFGHKVVQGAFVRAADIHAGAFADGFQPLKDFDGGRVICVGICA